MGRTHRGALLQSALGLWSALVLGAAVTIAGMQVVHSARVAGQLWRVSLSHLAESAGEAQDRVFGAEYMTSVREIRRRVEPR